MTIPELEAQAFRLWEACISLQAQAQEAEKRFNLMVSKIKEERRQPQFERDAQ